MDDWERFIEISLFEKEEFYSHLNMEDITDADYAHAKRVCKDFVWYWYIIKDRERYKRRDTVTLFINIQKLITYTWKIMIKIQNLHIFNIGM